MEDREVPLEIFMQYKEAENDVPKEKVSEEE
jgi:hypothetical protein